MYQILSAFIRKILWNNDAIRFECFDLDLLIFISIKIFPSYTSTNICVIHFFKNINLN